MKPRIAKCDLGEFRQWVVYTANSATYFKTYEQALNFAKKACYG